MAAADSSSVFFARVAELGLGDLKGVFTAQGWTTFADFAFACSDFKGSDPALFKTEVITPLVGEETNRVSRIRRLFMQSYAIGAAEMERFANPTLDKPVAMHPIDRTEALERVTKRMVGFQVSAESEPSHTLINRFTTFLSTGQVKHIPWEKRTARDQEVIEEDEVPGLKLNEEGHFVPATAKGPTVDVSGELRWDLAMRRSCVAMDVAGLCTFETATLWHEAMKAAYLSNPPMGYRRVSWTQLRNADQKLWQILASSCAGGCKAKPGETMTRFEAAYKEAISSTEVRHLLNPFQGNDSASSSTTRFSTPPSGDRPPEVQRLQNRLANAEAQIAGQKRRLDQGKGGGKGGGKDGGKDGKKNKRARGGAESLKSRYHKAGLAFNTMSGQPICYKYNLDGCPAAQPGQKCHNGLHVCGRAQCQSAAMPHAASTH